MRNCALRIIADEPAGSKSSPATIPAVFHACEQLRPHLETLMGKGGFRALLSRALTLARVEAPLLGSIQVGADGSLKGLEDFETQAGPEQSAQARSILLAQLLGLLAAFIGQSLMLRLAGEVWPDVPLTDLDFGKEANHEKTK
jgi:hypothetical protein